MLTVTPVTLLPRTFLGSFKPFLRVTTNALLPLRNGGKVSGNATGPMRDCVGISLKTVSLTMGATRYDPSWIVVGK
jgi:hypothetical protein